METIRSLMQLLRIIGSLCLIGLPIGYCYQRSKYLKTTYYRQIRLGYWSMLQDKGRLGEYRSYKFLRDLPGYKKFLFNLYLPKDNGGTSEIDVVMLHETGIYVLESKNYSGWIYGTETQRTWTQTIQKDNGQIEKNTFYNPILQNKSHIKWLKAYLKDDTLPIFSCIVFSERCDLKEIHLTSGEHAVINRDDLRFTVKRIAKQNGNLLTRPQIEDLIDQLYPLTQVTEAEKLAHIQAIRTKTQPQPTDPNVCPRCGGKLVLKTAAKGQFQGSQFYGCSNYPACRYIKKI